ncbi:hypothetical protein MCUN1_003423 [Malassezia cuniculi]|uniref:K Homology domain-containing protein n=1 Tax=Malassezia cuniculi TaxID=948313 RepID=A0AAF0J7Y9_9BASI|nr:hypothetical protein MCUN1_003423 [Malassezia cuniculi]
MVVAPEQNAAATEPMADPFPSLTETVPEPESEPSRPRAGGSAGRSSRPDVSSQDAFPTLGASTPRAQPKTWVSRVPVIQRVTHQSSITLALAQDQLARLSDVLKRVHDKNPGVTVEASTTRRTGSTVFIIKGPYENAVEAARRELAVQLARRVELSVQVPASLRAHVIGSGGRNIRAITEETGVRINIPQRTGEQTETSDVSDPLLGEQITVTIEGDEVNARRAESLVQGLIAERISKISQRLTQIDPLYYCFIAGARDANTRALAQSIGGDLSISVPSSGPIVVSGDRDAVGKAVRAIEDRVAELSRTLRTLSTSIPRRQHQFLTGDNAEDILAKTQCSIELPAEGDNVTIRGPQQQLANGLGATIEKANAMRIEVVDVAAGTDAQHAANVLAWLAGHIPATDGAEVHLPKSDTAIEIVGTDAARVEAARDAISSLVSSITRDHVRTVEIDPLVLKLLGGRRAPGVRAIEAKGIDVVFPPTGSDSSDVLLVQRNSSADLAEAAAELERLASGVADIRTEVLNIPARFHNALVGRDRTTLNAIVGEDSPAAVSFGADATAPSSVKASLNADSVVVRGTKDAVARAVERIKSIAADAESGSLSDSHAEEFSVESAYIPHLIGRGGSTLTRLREQLGVRVNVEEPETKGKGSVRVSVSGVKVCAVEARERLEARVARIADDTLLTLRVPRALQGALIGQGGKYVTRLQEKYEVHINFPQISSDSDEVTIRGGRKGANAAKAELVELLQYEQEHSHEDEITVSREALARILGRGGSRVNEIRAETEAQIDLVEGGSAARRSGEDARLHLRGTQKAVAAARKIINDIVAELNDTQTIELSIPWRIHGNLIGTRGQHIREICTRAGAQNANIVRFPPAGTPDDKVVVRGPSAIAGKVAAALESEARELTDRVVLGAVAPQRVHRILISRGGRRDSEWQTEHRAAVIVPGWREYAELGEPSNAAELGDADPATIVKVHGRPDGAAAVVKAIAEIVEAEAARKPRRAAAAARIDTDA